MPPAVPPSRPPRRRAPARGPAAPSPYDARPWLASYPEGVPADFDFPVVPVTRLLDDAAASFPTAPALAFLGATLTYRELRQQVDAFANGLQGLGVGKGDRVALVLPNCPQGVIAFFAVLRLGAVVVQHDPRYTEAELRAQLADCGATVVVCLDRGYERVAAVKAQTSVRHVVVTSLADYLPRATRLGLLLPLGRARRQRAELTAPLPKGAHVRQFTSLVKGAGHPARQVPLDPRSDLALLQYTAGTTGTPQGAMLTHYNLVSNTYMNRLWDVEATVGKEVTLGVLPLSHVYGLTVAMLGTVLLSGTLVLLPRFDLDRVLAAIEDHRPTLFPGVPPVYRALADSPRARDHDLRSLRLCLSGALRLPADVQERFTALTGARLVEGYGTTEASPTTHCGPTVGPLRPGTVGLPLPGTRCRLVAQDDPTREVPVGEPGELAVAGPQVFQGYWGGRGQEGSVTEDGYLLTGDVAVMSEDGWFTLVDRKQDIVTSGGSTVYPSQVEQVLQRVPGVAEAVVVGVPDAHGGETVTAFVVLEPGATVTPDDLLAAAAQELAAYELPGSVELLDELPRSAVGTVLRRVLAERERAPERPERPARAPGGRRPEEELPSGPPAEPEQAPEGPTTAPARAARQGGARKAAARKAPAEKEPAEKAPAKKAPAKKAPARKVPAKKATGERAAGQEPPAPPPDGPAAP